MTEMLGKAIEIEGLIRILRDGKPSPEVYDLLIQKSKEINDWAKAVKKSDADSVKGLDASEKASSSIPESAIEQEKKDDLRMEEAEKMEVDAVAADDDIILNLDDEEPVKSSGGSITVSSVGNVSDAETRHNSNLKAYFSLNDRFLYSRELFDGNMKMFDSTLKYLEGVDDFGVVEDYFYNELDWNPDNEYVKSFMDTLKSKF